MKTCLFIPTYNCSQFIEKALTDALSSLSTLVDAILIIDNCSIDSTFNQILSYDFSKYPVAIYIFQNQTNIGLGGSYKSAFSIAYSMGFTHLGVLFGDAQGSASDLFNILSSPQFTQDSADFYCASRFTKYSRLQGYSQLRRVANKFFNLFFSFLYQSYISDLGGYGIFKINTILQLPLVRMTNSLGFSYELLSYLVKSNKSILVYPASWADFGQPSNVRIITQILKFFISVIKIRLFPIPSVCDQSPHSLSALSKLISTR